VPGAQIYKTEVIDAAEVMPNRREDAVLLVLSQFPNGEVTQNGSLPNAVALNRHLS